MVHKQLPTPAITDIPIGDGFFNNNIYQRSSRAIDMKFYCVIYRVRQVQFIVYWVVVEHNKSY